MKESEEGYGRRKTRRAGAAVAGSERDRGVREGGAGEIRAGVQGGAVRRTPPQRRTGEPRERAGEGKPADAASGGRGRAEHVDSQRVTAVGRRQGRSGVSRCKGRCATQ